MPAADQAQAGAEAQVHQLAVTASQDLNKLSRALQQAGVDQDTVNQIDEAANVCNDIASAGVGNTGEQPAPPANPGSDPSVSPPADSLTAAIQDYHNSAVAGASA
jgi:hypothetical protein